MQQNTVDFIDNAVQEFSPEPGPETGASGTQKSNRGLTKVIGITILLAVASIDNEMASSGGAVPSRSALQTF